MQSNTYKSEVDQWIRASATVGTAASAAAFVALMIWSEGMVRIVAGAALLAGAALPWWIIASTSYTVTDRTLVIRSGPFQWEILLREIVSVTKSNSLVSSPALSLDRLRIDRSGGAPILISPENRRRFLEDLRSRGTLGTSTV